MADVDPEGLERLLKKAGVGKRTRTKLLQANEEESTSAAQSKVRGHGSAAPTKPDLGDF